MKNTFESHCPGQLVIEIIKAYPNAFTKKQRRSMLGEIKNGIDNGDSKTTLSVLKGVCKILKFEIRRHNYDLANNLSTYYAGQSKWEFIDSCACGQGGCVGEQNNLTGEFRSGCYYYDLGSTFKTTILFKP